ncbi:MAG: hypothetical protein JWP97_6663 [Labilithrix sp.]|nr:hypothetical protein [Labilithrix sp.]
MGERREKQTLIPAFDPGALAKELEDSERPTTPPAYDPAAYARVIEERAKADAVHDTPHTMTAATPLLPPPEGDAPAGGDATAAMGRAMYGSYLSSDYPEALVLAERVLQRQPDHALARLVMEGCHDRLGTHADEASGVRISPWSVVRLTRPPFDVTEELGPADAMLGAIDGVSDVTMVAALAGITRPEAIERLHALLALGLVEVVA